MAIPTYSHAAGFAPPTANEIAEERRRGSSDILTELVIAVDQENNRKPLDLPEPVSAFVIGLEIGMRIMHTRSVLKGKE